MFADRRTNNEGDHDELDHEGDHDGDPEGDCDRDPDELDPEGTMRRGPVMVPHS